MKLNTVDILGISIDATTKQGALEVIREFLNSSDQHQIATINPEFIMAASEDERLQQILNASSLRLADGSGVLWAAKYDSLPKRGVLGAIIQMIYSGAALIFNPTYCTSVIPERTTGADLVPELCRLAVQENKFVYLLGGYKGSGKETAQVLQKQFPDLAIAGVDEDIVADYQNGSLVIDEAHDAAVIERINTAQPDMLLVALGGNQKQELWIAQYLAQLPSVKVAIGVGATFDFISGHVKRAPRALRSLGVEWLWRMFAQRRLSRIFTATVRFISAVVRSKVKK